MEILIGGTEFDSASSFFNTFDKIIFKLKQGIVLKSTGSNYKVLCDDGSLTDCSVKGKLRIRQLKTTNPVAVGDNVNIKTDSATGYNVITEVLDRRNYILRKASNLSKQSQIIASNVDQLFLMISVTMPETPAEFIDRYLATAEAYRIPAFIIINKTDLYGDTEIEKLEIIEAIYGKIGYRCIRLSLYSGEGLDELRQLMENKITLVSGNSGVGKTTLLNKLNPSLSLKTDSISEYHKQGKHITTFPEMHAMPFGGFVIDTPGIRGFGIIDMEKNEIYHFFPEIFRIAKDCRFNNCLHLDEPECAVRRAVETGVIDFSRYRSYLNMMEGDTRKYR